MRRSRLIMLVIPALVLSVLAAACSGGETVAPQPTPDFAALIQNAMQSQPSGATADEVASAVQAALAAQPGVTEAQVADTIAKALAAQPGVTEGQVGDAIARALAERPGVTEGQVAGAIADALAKQTPGLTEAQVGDTIAKALAERPGVTEGQVAGAIAQALTQQTPGLTEAEVSQAIAKALADRPGVTQADIEAAVQSAVSMAMPAMDESDMSMDMDRYGGVLLYGAGPNVEHLFHLTYSGGACAAWCMTVGDPLTAYGPDSEWVPEKSIAESFTMSEDKKTITFSLKPGILFHDGTEVNADSVKFSLDFVLDANNGAVTRSAVQSISNVEVIDNLTVAITTDEVFAPDYHQPWHDRRDAGLSDSVQ